MSEALRGMASCSSRAGPRAGQLSAADLDHRALDGAAAARFLTTLEAVLADPAREGLR